MPARRVVLLRHGRTSWNAEGRFQGHSDIPLDDLGLAQAQAAAATLAWLEPTRIVSSDLGRALATATPLANATGVQLLTDPRLRETHGGRWEGMRDEDISAQDAEMWWAWRSGADVAAGDSGERRAQVGERMLAAIDEHVSDLEVDDTLVVVTHGGAANAAIGALLGWPLEHWQSLGGLRNGHWAILRHWERPTFGRDETPSRPALSELSVRWRLAAYDVGPAVAAVQSRG